MKALIMVLIPAMLVSVVSAVETGYIYGTVIEARTGSPLPYANVVIVGTKMGAMTLNDGSFAIYGVPAGKYTIKVMMMGYKPVTKECVKVVASKGTELRIEMKETIVGKTQEIVVSAEPVQIDIRSTEVTHTVTKKVSVPELAYDDVVEAIALKGGVVRTGDELHVRGGRSGSVQYQIDAVPVNDPLGGGSVRSVATDNTKIYPKTRRHHEQRKPPKRTHPNRPPCPPRVVCVPRQPCGYYNTEEYAEVLENEFLTAIGNPLSTFSIDVDAASYANVRRFINADRMPPAAAVRAEEFINYFDYDYRKPQDGVPFSINLEYAVCPWNGEHTLVQIGLQGEDLSEEDRKPSNLVFLIDVSGSMEPENKLPLLQKAFLLLVDQLRDDDVVTIVTYAGEAGVHMCPTPGHKKNKIRYAIRKLRAGGSTAGHAGIQMAYDLASECFIPGGNNRVILATDGDFNVGVSSTPELIKVIEEKREVGVFLTVLGFGIGNYKDTRLEQLADKGNGNHAYIDNILEAKKVFVDGLTSTLYTIAKDVKIQVEFNPVKVASYRLIGYENRMLKKEDFADDRKDAGEIGAGHTVTALYEIVPVYYGDDGPGAGAVDSGDEFTGLDLTVDDGMKYVDTKLSEEAFGDEVVTVHVRYKKPDGDTSRLITTVVSGEPVEAGKASNDLRFASAVAMYAMILGESDHMGGITLEDVKEIAKKARGDDENGYRAEFIRQVELTELVIGLASK